MRTSDDLQAASSNFIPICGEVRDKIVLIQCLLLGTNSDADLLLSRKHRTPIPLPKIFRLSGLQEKKSMIDMQLLPFVPPLE